jgi:hypothetical protein
MMSLSIAFADGREVELSGEDPQAVSDELGALGYEDLAEEAFDGAKRRASIRVDEGTLPRFAPALDHLRTATPADFESVPGPQHVDDPIAARDACLIRLGASPLTYRLRSWEFGGEDRTFWSYTGTYAEGDRLVDNSGDALTVLSVERQATPIDDGVLVLERERRP